MLILMFSFFSELPEFHPIVQMLWEKSRAASRKMNVDDSSASVQKREPMPETPSEPSNELIPSKQENASQSDTWYHTASRLEKKALSQKNKGDIEGAIQSTKVVLEFRQAYLSKRTESRRDLSRAKQSVARTLVSLAHLVLITDAIRQAEKYFKQALGLYKSSGAPKGADCMLEIQRELERLRWQQKSAAGKSK